MFVDVDAQARAKESEWLIDPLTPVRPDRVAVNTGADTRRRAVEPLQHASGAVTSGEVLRLPLGHGLAHGREAIDAETVEAGGRVAARIELAQVDAAALDLPPVDERLGVHEALHGQTSHAGSGLARTPLDSRGLARGGACRRREQQPIETQRILPERVHRLERERAAHRAVQTLHEGAQGATGADVDEHERTVIQYTANRAVETYGRADHVPEVVRRHGLQRLSEHRGDDLPPRLVEAQGGDLRPERRPDRLDQRRMETVPDGESLRDDVELVERRGQGLEGFDTRADDEMAGEVGSGERAAGEQLAPGVEDIHRGHHRQHARADDEASQRLSGVDEQPQTLVEGHRACHDGGGVLAEAVAEQSLRHQALLHQHARHAVVQAHQCRAGVADVVEDVTPLAPPVEDIE